MKLGVIIALALMPLPIIWPAAHRVESADLSRDAFAKTVRDASNTRGLVQLAKHDNQDGHDGVEGGKHRHRPRHSKHHEAEQEAYGAQHFCGPYFKPSAVPYFRDYYSRENYANLPPGLRKHVEKTGHLPPGLEKKYERTGQLPPGLQKRFECGQTMPPDYSPYLYSVPPVAYERVGPLPPDSRLYLYGNDLILLNDHTKAIMDILRGAY
jgi:hypothetical protein